MKKLTKLEVNNRLSEMKSPIRIYSEPNGVIKTVSAKCITHKIKYKPYLGNILKGHGCPDCKKEKLPGAPVQEETFKAKLLRANPHFRLQYFNGRLSTAKALCLKCGLARTDLGVNLLNGCLNCKFLDLQTAKYSKAKKYRQMVERRKEEKKEAYRKHIQDRLRLCEHITCVGVPYLYTPNRNRRTYWKVRAQCNYCAYKYYARVENLFAGTKCKKCAMRWNKNKSHKLGKRNVMVQGYEHFALDYITKVRGHSPKSIETEKIPTIKYEWGGRTHRYFPDFYMPNINTLIEVKSDMTLGLGGWWGKREPPFEKNKAKHRAVVALGYKFKILVSDNKGRVVVLPNKWLEMSKKEVANFIADFRQRNS